MTITLNTFWIYLIIGITLLIAITLFLVHNLAGLNLFSKHDQRVIKDFLKKYPDVTPDYMAKGLRIQNIENNQEIHELNRKIDTLQDIVDNLKDVAESIKEQQDNE